MAIDHIHLWRKGSSSRTFILLHGTGGTENDLLPIAQSLDPTAKVLAIRGRSLDEGYPRFFRRLAEGIFDEADLVAKTNELADFILASAETYSFDVQSTVAVGYSNGANIAAACLLLRADALQHAVLYRAMVPLKPLEPSNLIGHQVLLTTGQYDRMISPQSGAELAALLESCGATLRHLQFPSGHELTRPDITHAATWLAEIE